MLNRCHVISNRFEPCQPVVPLHPCAEPPPQVQPVVLQHDAHTQNLYTKLPPTFLQSPHRTYDPEEADFFYVPVYASAFAWPVFGWADFPWFGGTFPRVQHLSNMYLEAKRWVQKNFPYW